MKGKIIRFPNANEAAKLKDLIKDDFNKLQALIGKGLNNYPNSDLGKTLSSPAKYDDALQGKFCKTEFQEMPKITAKKFFEWIMKGIVKNITILDLLLDTSKKTIDGKLFQVIST